MYMQNSFEQECLSVALHHHNTWITETFTMDNFFSFDLDINLVLSDRDLDLSFQMILIF